MRLSFFTASLSACLLLAVGCDMPAAHNGLSKSAAALGVAGSLPDAIAGPRQDVKIHVPIQSLPLQYAAKRGSEVQLFSHGVWHGKTIDLYFLPASNLIEHGQQYELRTAKGLQKVAAADIRSDGSWYTVWHVGSYQVPAHLPFFILAKSNSGDYGLIQINTRN